MAYAFVCDHCGKKFELETPLAQECPFCFWTSSVKKEDELASQKKGPAAASHQPVPGFARKFSSKNLGYLARVLAFFALAAIVGWGGVKVYKKFAASGASGWKAFSIKPSRDSEGTPGVPAAVGVEELSAQEKDVLQREVTIPKLREPSQGEQKILDRVASFQTGRSENLPSAAWTLEQYQQMIADQEARYKMPFARSYKKKLEELFTDKYLAASDAFAKGDVLLARNLWIESLAFPPYSTDVKKHRAVALTMLRPFINDTLAKVSAMNQSLVDRGKRGREEALSASYRKLGILIAQKNWPEALAAIAPMTSEVNALRKNGKAQEMPAPYPASFGTIDADLQRPLMDLMAPSPSSIADLQPLQQDLVEKKEILETFTEEYVKSAMAAYQSALAAIHQEKWQEAAQILGSIQGPHELQEDAMAKMAVLGKMVKGTQSSI